MKLTQPASTRRATAIQRSFMGRQRPGSAARSASLRLNGALLGARGRDDRHGPGLRRADHRHAFGCRRRADHAVMGAATGHVGAPAGGRAVHQGLRSAAVGRHGLRPGSPRHDADEDEGASPTDVLPCRWAAPPLTSWSIGCWHGVAVSVPPYQKVRTGTRFATQRDKDRRPGHGNAVGVMAGCNRAGVSPVWTSAHRIGSTGRARTRMSTRRPTVPVSMAAPSTNRPGRTRKLPPAGAVRFRHGRRA